MDDVERGTDTDNPDGSYEDGVSHCCPLGDGTDCCAGYDPGMCFKYGGIYEQCVPEGEIISGKVICAFCCDGLVEVEDLQSMEDTSAEFPDGCGLEGPPDLLRCVPCGNGVCDSSENRCNCPEDCDDTSDGSNVVN